MADLIEVVRCKDCIYHPIVPENWNGDRFRLDWPAGEDGWNECPCHCPDDDFYSWVPGDDWFCGNGKRK